ncbi:hypothetical protein P3549_23330, partial [Vibrio parahaemolyticus]|nr:hypothetical protein [Vibrio parahaemolyticus]
ANSFCIAVFLSYAVICGVALFGINYPPLTITFGWFAFSVAVAISSPKLSVWVKEDQDWE